MMDRTYAYQVMGGVRIPGRDKVIALGIVAGASEKDINHHYDILQTNEMLEDAGEKLLF